MKSSYILYLMLACVFLMLTLVVGVYGYTVETNEYGQEILFPEYRQDGIYFDLVNLDNNALDLSEIHSYVVEIGEKRYSGKFAHDSKDGWALSGLLMQGQKKEIRISYSTRTREETCGMPAKISLYTFKGELISRYSEVPGCNVPDQISYGLRKTGPCTAEFYDGILRINWEIKSIDEKEVTVVKKMNNRKSEEYTLMVAAIGVGRADCMDLESGACMTEIKDVKYLEDGPSFIIKDNRLGTEVKIGEEFETIPCFKGYGGGFYARTVDQSQVQLEQNDVVNHNKDVVDAEIVSSGSDLGLLLAEETSCETGCFVGSECYPEGTRAFFYSNPVYCSQKSWMSQKQTGAVCDLDNECLSGTCKQSVCYEQSAENTEEKTNWITRLLLWIDNLI